MKKGKMLCYAGVWLIMILVLTACGAKKSSYDGSYENAKADMDTGTASTTTEYDSTADTVGNSDVDMAEGNLTGKMKSKDTQSENADGIENSSALTSKQLQSLTQEKIIKNFNLEVETQDFDSLIKNINDKIKSLGGYVESSSISGNSYYGSDNNRNGSVVARVPAAKVDEFVNTVDETANVTSNESSVDNVTLQYVDAQSRVKALKIEQDRLFAILEKTEKLENIITLESRLSEIRYELQNYESQLRAYDNQVEYSTVKMNIKEVERITPVTKKKPTFTSRIKDGFSNTIYNISEGFKNFLVWLIVNLPYLLIWGIIIFIAVVVILKIMKKYNIKNDDNQQGK